MLEKFSLFVVVMLFLLAGQALAEKNPGEIDMVLPDVFKPIGNCKYTAEDGKVYLRAEKLPLSIPVDFVDLPDFIDPFLEGNEKGIRASKGFETYIRRSHRIEKRADSAILTIDGAMKDMKSGEVKLVRQIIRFNGKDMTVFFMSAPSDLLSKYLRMLPSL